MAAHAPRAVLRSRVLRTAPLRFATTAATHRAVARLSPRAPDSVAAHADDVTPPSIASPHLPPGSPRASMSSASFRPIPLDLSNCSLRTLPSAFSEAAAAVVLDLTENPLPALPAGSFLGFTQLQQLAVPPAVPCPGGSGAWEDVTTYGSSRLCRGQRNPCNGSEELAPLCPENAACAPDGPGLSQCLCASPFHGYKCLRQGAFPVPLFCSVLGTVTAALSLALWGTQRRHAAGP
uniref:All-trans retinoic acid induced differentiation factor n=1 Tax=Phasianus colchicus TaxID=9054 RepID=A0A669PM34_PHACC